VHIFYADIKTKRLIIASSSKVQANNRPMGLVQHL